MNANDVCRTCLCSNGTMHSISNSNLTTSEGYIPVVNLLQVFSRTQISFENGFSDKICAECLRDIYQPHSFKLKYEKSEAIISQLKGVKILLKKLKAAPIKYGNGSAKDDLTSGQNIKCERSDEFLANSKTMSLNACLKYEELMDYDRLEQLPIEILPDQIGWIDQDIKEEPELDISTECDFSEICAEENGAGNQSDIEILECSDDPNCFDEQITDNRAEGKMCNADYVECFECNANNGSQRSTVKYKLLCSICQKTFQSKSRYDYHMQTHTSHACTRTFRNKSHLKYPTISKCGKSITQSSVQCEICSKIHSAERTYKCEICSKMFRCEQFLKTHLETEHKDLKSMHKRDLKCEFCSKIFGKRYHLIRHMQIHTNDPFKCDLCPKTFRYKNNLTAHSEEKHDIKYTGKNIFKCETCSKIFWTRKKLIEHLRSHTGERPFKCEICMRAYRYKKALTRHKITNRCDETAVKTFNNFQCELCSKNFACQSDLIDHSRYHTKEKPFKCDICSKSYRYRSSLRVHLTLKHDNAATDKKSFKCKICSKMFGRSSDLIDHSRSHSGEKPFKCELCSKCYPYQGSLRLHIQMKHAADYPKTDQFQCDVCWKMFAWKHSLSKHMQIHTKS